MTRRDLTVRNTPRSAALPAFLALAAGAYLAPRAGAAIVAADPADNRIGASSIPTGNIGASGYLLFSVNGGSSASADAASGAAATGGYASSFTFASGTKFFSDAGTSTPYTNLTANGTTYRTGVVYFAPGSNPNYYNLVTFALGASTPSSFILSVLQDNATNQNNNDSSLQVTGSNSATQATAGNGGGAAGNNSNDFYAFLVTNASPGDTITIAAQPGASPAVTALIGGVAFATPEPGSLALVALAGAALLARRGRKPAR